MAVGFQHPAVTTHVGDGFAFLAKCKNEFDVIITDSSDPEGPAETLFGQAYFELLHTALRDGGVITTQGCAVLVSLASCAPSCCFCPVSVALVQCFSSILIQSPQITPITGNL